ncbi:hypothetical protein PUR49_06650 [Streptomyces sp. BE147]|uniref:hypothetical protein n=1 Tax=Streptomyces sp. BE147 TaxID=3002524 RepID=UPI002E78E5E3|nr:hypothetical protein [Streptomyces sp. BE147]MEE1736186.1 hypothetical protein [Streptomyces sp. BE147]
MVRAPEACTADRRQLLRRCAHRASATAAVGTRGAGSSPPLGLGAAEGGRRLRAGHLLWEGPAERGRAFLLTLLDFAGGADRARIVGRTDAQSGLVGFGHAAELLSC